MDTALDPGLIDKFRADLARVCLDWDDSDRIGVAVSGGPDSLALLLLAHAALPGRVAAATVDHGLRAGSVAEAAMVARVCRDLGIDHETVRVELEPGNLQDRARDARYAALCSVFGKRGIDTFATAHHADDQAETVLMRLTRGSGLAGLAGVRARRVIVSEDPLGEYFVVRPLLHWRREELGEIVAKAGLEPVTDPSNDDDRFDRARIRKVLASLPDLDPLAIARSAEFLQDAEEAVTDQIAYVRALKVTREGDTVWYQWGWPRLVELEVVADILAEFGAEVTRSAVAKLIEQVRRDGHGTLGGVMVRRNWHQADANTKHDAWRFEREPPRRSG